MYTEMYVHMFGHTYSMQSLMFDRTWEKSSAMKQNKQLSLNKKCFCFVNSGFSLISDYDYEVLALTLS